MSKVGPARKTNVSMKAIADLSAVGDRRSRCRLTLVRDKDNLNLPTKLHITTYTDLFYWIPKKGR